MNPSDSCGHELVIETIERCESFAEEWFEDEAIETGDYFTNVTMWTDSDFTVEVKHGMGYEQLPYSQDVELITHDHEEGVTSYERFTRYPTRVGAPETHEFEILEGDAH